MTLCIQNAVICTPHEVIAEGAVLVENGRIQAVGPLQAIPQPGDAQAVDAQGNFLIPGLIDLQLNGGFGWDFTQNPGAIWKVAEQLPRYGVTAFLPTIITAPLSTVMLAQAVMAEGRPAAFAGAIPLGLHLEGPFLNPSKKGAHNPAHLRLPALPDIADWTPERSVRLVTLAPELPGAFAVIASLVAQGVVVGAGHSQATYAEAQASFAAGVRYGVHLFNAMPALHHRSPGLAGALLADDRLTIGLIPDGIHVHPALVKVAWQAAGNGRLNLVTDAMSALGMSPGVYRLSDFDVIVDETSARLPNGALAGSILPPDAALRNFIAFTGCSLAEALPTMTTTPAALLGLSRCKGQIKPGYDADLVLLAPDLTVVGVVIAGRFIYENTDRFLLARSVL